MTTPLPAGLGDEQRRELAAARSAWRKIQRAAGVAALSGWTMAVFAVVTVLLSYNSLSAVLIAVALGAAAVVELRGRRRLLELVPGATKALALNQAVLAVLIVLYAAWGVHGSKTISADVMKMVTQSLGPDAADTLKENPQIIEKMVLLIYGTLAVAAVAGQGSLALYYMGRKRWVQRYLNETPPWILGMQREGMRL